MADTCVLTAQMQAVKRETEVSHFPRLPALHHIHSCADKRLLSDSEGSSKPQGNKAEVGLFSTMACKHSVDKAASQAVTTVQAQVVSAAEAAQAAQGMAAAIGSTNLGPGQDQITDALSKMPRAALFDIMAQMKGLIQQNQQQARQILVTNPSLTRALFQAQILLGMLKNPLSADAAAQPGPPQAVPQHMPQPVPAPQAQFPPVHIQSQHQHATAMRPQHPPSANTIAHFPNQDMQLQALPQQQQPGGSMLGGSQQGGSNSGAPQPMRHAPGHSMPGMLL